MTNFFDLLVQASSRPESWKDPMWADRRFQLLIANSPFPFGRWNDPIPQRGLRLLIGVATWSGYDMRLLDVIAEAPPPSDPSAAPLIHLFNTADCKEPGDFKKYIPKLRGVSQTPVVGVWRDGRLYEAKEGYEARELVARMFGSGSAEIVQFVDNWIKGRSSARGA
jgi:hypothetical protein